MKSGFSIRKLLFALIFSFVICLLFLLMEIISVAPLVSIMMRGIFTEDPAVVISNIYGNYISSEPVTILSICIEILLAILAIVSIFIFLRKIISTMFMGESYIRRAYTVFFIFALILPNLLVILCAVLSFSITPLIIITSIISVAIFVFSIIVLEKITPDMVVTDFRKKLFEGSEK